MITVVVFGLPGSGKSYFAARLAQVIHASYISSDELRMQVHTERTYTEKEKLSIYNTMLLKMQEGAGNGENVVLDATFFKQGIRQMFINAVPDSSPIIFIEVQANEPLTRKRLSYKRPYSDADFEVYEKVKAAWEPMTDPHLILQSTDDNINEMLQEATDYIKIKNDKRRN